MSNPANPLPLLIAGGYFNNRRPVWTTPPGTLLDVHEGENISLHLGATLPEGTPTFAVTEGSLPPGLVLTASGQILGTAPPVDETTVWTFIITALGTLPGAETRRDFAITVRNVYADGSVVLHLRFNAGLLDETGQNSPSLMSEGNAPLTFVAGAAGTAMLSPASGEYVAVAHPSRWPVGDFTLEFFTRRDGDPTTYASVAKGTGLLRSEALPATAYSVDAANGYFVGTAATPANYTAPSYWHHVALQREGGTVSLFTDGLRTGINGFDLPANTLPLTIGKGLRALVDEFRLSATARYPTAFTRPQAALPAPADDTLPGEVCFHVRMDAVDGLANLAGTGTPINQGVAAGVTGPFPDTSAASFLTSGGVTTLTTSMAACFADAQGPWTMEFWIKRDMTTGTGAIFSCEGGGSGFSILLQGSSGRPDYGWTRTNGVRVVSSFPATLPLDTWTHVALVRSTQQIALFLDGVMVGTAAKHEFGTNIPATGPAWIGTFDGRTSRLGAALYDFRITGLVRYPQPPPSAPFPG